MEQTETKMRVEDVTGPDDRGRYSYTLCWEDPGGRYEPALSKDGQPVGYRHAQCFFAVPPTDVLKLIQQSRQEKVMRDPTAAESVELANLFHLSRTAVARPGLGAEHPGLVRHERKIWTAHEFSRLHPTIGTTMAYKLLERVLHPAPIEDNVR